MNKDLILESLVNSCLTFSPNKFVPFLMSKEVIVSYPNKIRFYSFFKIMIDCTKKESIGKLNLKIEQLDDVENQFYYNFYDEVHKYARLTIIVTIIKDKVKIEVMPF